MRDEISKQLKGFPQFDSKYKFQYITDKEDTEILEYFKNLLLSLQDLILIEKMFTLKKIFRLLLDIELFMKIFQNLFQILGF